MQNIQRSNGCDRFCFALPDAEKELKYVARMLSLCQNIKASAKGKELLDAVNEAFKKLKQLKANGRYVIFTEYRQTQQYIYETFEKSKDKGEVLIFSGNYSRDYDITRKFREEYDILISTVIGSEGLNLEFCSLLINYDMPWSALRIKRRVGRLYRIANMNAVQKQNNLPSAHDLSGNNFCISALPPHLC